MFFSFLSRKRTVMLRRLGKPFNRRWSFLLNIRELMMVRWLSQKTEFKSLFNKFWLTCMRLLIRHWTRQKGFCSNILIPNTKLDSFKVVHDGGFGGQSRYNILERGSLISFLFYFSAMLAELLCLCKNNNIYIFTFSFGAFI